MFSFKELNNLYYLNSILNLDLDLENYIPEIPEIYNYSSLLEIREFLVFLKKFGKIDFDFVKIFKNFIQMDEEFFNANFSLNLLILLDFY